MNIKYMGRISKFKQQIRFGVINCTNQKDEKIISELYNQLEEIWHNISFETNELYHTCLYIPVIDKRDYMDLGITYREIVKNLKLKKEVK